MAYPLIISSAWALDGSRARWPTVDRISRCPIRVADRRDDGLTSRRPRSIPRRTHRRQCEYAQVVRRYWVGRNVCDVDDDRARGLRDPAYVHRPADRYDLWSRCVGRCISPADN